MTNSNIGNHTQGGTPLPQKLSVSFLERPYSAYSYSYPHKSSYGPLSPSADLRLVWQSENRESLFLYVHLPFCEMRCGFCNLFTRAGGHDEFDRYLDSLERQMKVMSDSTAGDRQISRMAIGGGTPTILSPTQLSRLFGMLENSFEVKPSLAETSIETSPSTATPDRLEFLKSIGVHRVSIGVQSFIDLEVHAIGRPQKITEVHSALERIRAIGFPILNIDLIYGQPHQTRSSWMESIDGALRYQPEEIFLYPLYVRPETGLAKRGKNLSREESFCQLCYRDAREQLLCEGYKRFSMRSFRKSITSQSQEDILVNQVSYSCQVDGMLGLGCGARSYTQALHYSSRFAVAMAGVHSILNDWMNQTDDDFGKATWGIWLSEEERQRRFVIQSLLNRDGLDCHRFRAEFDVEATDQLPEMISLIEKGYLESTDRGWRLTEESMGLSDAIGPFLYSSASQSAIREFTQL